MGNVMKSTMTLYCGLLRNWTKYKFLVRKQWPSCCTCKRYGGRKPQCDVWEQEKYPMLAKIQCGYRILPFQLEEYPQLSKERFVGRRMDWLIYHLTGEVFTHYWYGIQCKAFGYVRNRKHKGIVASAIIRASTIPDTNVLIYLEDNVAYIGSVNNRLKVWTIHSPNSEWAQYDCPIASRGTICKHVVKVFKMLYSDIEDDVIIREAGILHGVERTVPMSQIWIKGYTAFARKAL